MAIRNEIIIRDVSCSSNEIRTTFCLNGNLDKYFKTNEFIVSYSTEISNIPYGVAVIPFVCNVLPSVWLTNAVLYCDELDYDFYNCIEFIKAGYKSMYPTLQFSGEIKCKTVRYQPTKRDEKSLVFFSGGVDAFASLVAHVDENPTLFSICGADINVENQVGWEVVMGEIRNVSSVFNLPAIYCYSNFRQFINEENLCLLVDNLGAKIDYWYGFQHGIALLGHVAPLTYKRGYNNIYIGASYTLRERAICTCASDPRIDNNVRFLDALVYHDQFDKNRQEKIRSIISFSKKNDIAIKLRVCWQSDTGGNCCLCEKCIRTIYAILAEKEDPKGFGFYNVNLGLMKRRLQKDIVLSKTSMPFWDDIIERINEYPKGTTHVEWLRNYTALKLNSNVVKVSHSLILDLNRKIMKIALRCVRLLKKINICTLRG